MSSNSGPSLPRLNQMKVFVLATSTINISPLAFSLQRTRLGQCLQIFALNSRFQPSTSGSVSHVRYTGSHCHFHSVVQNMTEVNSSTRPKNRPYDAIDTPNILMLLGVGDAVQSSNPHGIASIYNLHGVGNALQDDPMVILAYQLKASLDASSFKHSLITRPDTSRCRR